MAKMEGSPKIDVEITLKLNEAEAQFLEGMAGFSHEALLNHIREFTGLHYTEDACPTGRNGAGFLSLMESCKRDLPPILRRIHESRGVFNGTLAAVKK